VRRAGRDHLRHFYLRARDAVRQLKVLKREFVQPAARLRVLLG
jgi:hypothetical protein